MKFKALVLTLMLPAMFLIGCGQQMQTNEAAAGNALQNLANNGAITQEEADSVEGRLLDESVEVTDTGSGNSIMMKIGGADLLIDLFDNLTGAADEVAMVINGIEVPTELAVDKDSFQALIASLVTSQLEGIDVLGMPVGDLVQAGLSLINGDTQTFDFSNLFGTLIRGALNMYMGGSPIGMIVGALAGPIIDNVLDEVFDSGDSQADQNQNQNNNNQDNSGGDLLSGIVNTIGGVFGNGGNNNNPLGGIFSLITNLFK